ncbi:MAG: glycosyltransferase family 2 protein [Spirochaetota bacterium]
MNSDQSNDFSRHREVVCADDCSMGSGLSVAIITFNEENNIHDCIASCHEIADEVIVLDSFSKDETLTIARKFAKVKVHQHPFNGHIEQKNRAIGLCNNPWVLSLDADERSTPKLNQLIQKTLENKPDVAGFKVRRLTYHMGQYIRHSGWYPQYRYRLFHKDKAEWIGENPHDYITISGEGKKLAADIIHYSFLDLSQQIETINKFSSIVSYTRYQKGQHFSIFVNRGGFHWRVIPPCLTRFILWADRIHRVACAMSR